MTVISFAEAYRKRVGLRLRTLMIDGRHMTEAEFRAIPVDDTSDDAGEIIGWVNVRCERCAVLQRSTALKRRRTHIVWQRDGDGALRVTHWGAADRRIKQWRIPQLFVIGEDSTNPPETAA
jgi:hypothetical protein